MPRTDFSDADNRDRTGTEPWDGRCAPEFLKYKQDMLVFAAAIYLHEDDYSITQALLGGDQGGPAQGADPMPDQNQAGYTNATRKIPWGETTFSDRCDKFGRFFKTWILV